MSEDVRKRLAKVRGERSQNAFAKDLGVGQSTYRRYEEGPNRIPEDFLATVAEREGVSLNWLVLGEGPMRRADIVGEAPAAYGREPSITIAGQVTGFAAANPLSPVDYSEHQLQPRPVHIVAFFAEVKDASMVPVAWPGQFIAYTHEQPRQNAPAYVKFRGQSPLFKVFSTQNVVGIGVSVILTSRAQIDVETGEPYPTIVRPIEELQWAYRWIGTFEPEAVQEAE